MRNAKAIVTITEGRGTTKRFPVLRVQSYTTDQSIDNDADSFSVDIGDSDNMLGMALDRDSEVKVELFIDDVKKGAMHQIFTGLADTVQKEEDGIISISGRDLPGACAVDTDAVPGRFPHVDPKAFIEKRAAALGIHQVKIPKMSPIKGLYTDGSETEWQLWYRIARARGMYMWSDNLGSLIIDKLGYKASPDYHFGASVRPGPRNWQPVEAYKLSSNKQTRIRRVIMYGQTTSSTAKGSQGMVQQSVDVHIRNWTRRPIMVDSNQSAKTPKDLKVEAGDDMFESIVGAQEHTIRVRDTGSLIEQNTMARLTLPDENIDEVFFVVGVQRQGGPDGETQIVRLREKGFALSNRVPDAPILSGKDLAKNKSVGGISQAVGELGVRWHDSFVRATNDYGVAAGWDFALFLGVLLSICQQETGFKNVRQSHSGALNGVEWHPRPTEADVLPGPIRATTPEGASVTGPVDSLRQEITKWQQTFANAQGNIFNPFYPSGEAGVGPMQLTSAGFKEEADALGWSGAAKIGEYDGGRWNPDSNIRIAAKALVAKGKENPPADPTDPTQIWIAVRRYNGSGSAAEHYADSVKAIYNTDWAKQVDKAIAPVVALAPGSTETDIKLPDGTKLALPDNTPAEARKAISFCLSRLGDNYLWGGNGPLYDCSGLVTAGLNSGSPGLRNVLGQPGGGRLSTRETTYTLSGLSSDRSKQRFPSPTKDNLLPGDLVFFNGYEHVGMYLNDGWFIHDPHTGAQIRIDNLGEPWYRDHYDGARRVVNWANTGKPLP